MAQHAPGPWAVVPYGDGNSLVVHCTEDDRVCFMARPGIAGRMAEIRANARLIAAAPDLLAALRELDAMYRRIAPDDPDGLSPDLHPAWKACKAALAKAEGRETEAGNAV